MSAKKARNEATRKARGTLGPKEKLKSKESSRTRRSCPLSLRRPLRSPSRSLRRPGGSPPCNPCPCEGHPTMGRRPGVGPGLGGAARDERDALPGLVSSVRVRQPRAPKPPRTRSRLLREDEDLDDRDGDDDARGQSREKRPPFVPVPPRRHELPSSFANVSDEELHEACQVLCATLARVLQNRERVKSFYLLTWESVLSTRPFNPEKGKLRSWLVLVSKSLYLHDWRDREAREQREAIAHEAYHYAAAAHHHGVCRSGARRARRRRGAARGGPVAARRPAGAPRRSPRRAARPRAARRRIDDAQELARLAA